MVTVANRVQMNINHTTEPNPRKLDIVRNEVILKKTGKLLSKTFPLILNEADFLDIR